MLSKYIDAAIHKHLTLPKIDGIVLKVRHRKGRLMQWEMLP